MERAKMTERKVPVPKIITTLWLGTWERPSESESRSVMYDSLRPHGLSPWNSPGQNTGVGSLSFLQGIFPTQGSNPGLPHYRRIFYQLSHKGSPRILEWVACPFCRGFSPLSNQTRVSCIASRFFTNWAMREALRRTEGKTSVVSCWNGTWTENLELENRRKDACLYIPLFWRKQIKYLRKNIRNLLSGLYKHKMTLRLVRDVFRHSSPNQNKLSRSDSTNIFLT